MDGHTRHTDQPEPCLSPGLKAFLGVSDLSPESMKIIRAASPATYIKNTMPPYLLVHGDSDHYVPYDQSVLMLNEMKQAGARVELYTVKGGGHGDWDDDPVKSQYKDAVLMWLQKTLK
jgi:dipeptidyl aminopeptidase/acylaminoacyl peptidase